MWGDLKAVSREVARHAEVDGYLASTSFQNGDWTQDFDVSDRNEIAFEIIEAGRGGSAGTTY